jgi:hypothetical protein
MTLVLALLVRRPTHLRKLHRPPWRPVALSRCKGGRHECVDGVCSAKCREAMRAWTAIRRSLRAEIALSPIMPSCPPLIYSSPKQTIAYHKQETKTNLTHIPVHFSRLHGGRGGRPVCLASCFVAVLRCACFVVGRGCGLGFDQYCLWILFYAFVFSVFTLLTLLSPISLATRSRLAPPSFFVSVLALGVILFLRTG